MRKIIFITPHYYPSTLSGSGIVVKNLAEEFAKHGNDISVITSNALTTRYWYDPIFGRKIKEKFSYIHNVKVYRLPCNQLYTGLCFVMVKVLHNFLPRHIYSKLTLEASGPHLRGLFKVLKSQDINVVHFSPSPISINKQVIEALDKMKKKLKVILTPFFHSQMSDFTNPELKKIFDKVDIIHTITAAEKNDIIKRFAINKKKIVIVPLFLDTSRMHTVEKLKKNVLSFRQKFNLTKRKIVLFAGIKGSAKGAVDLLMAMNMLYKINSKYILIAIGTNTQEWDQAKAHIDKNCLLDFEYTLGKEKEIIFSACDVFCMPSKSETFGLVYLEAWHKKKPVIAADIPAVRELLGEAAIFVSYGNRRMIMEKIEQISYNTSLAKKIGSKGYRKLMAQFDSSKVFPRYMRLFSTK